MGRRLSTARRAVVHGLSAASYRTIERFGRGGWPGEAGYPGAPSRRPHVRPNQDRLTGWPILAGVLRFWDHAWRTFDSILPDPLGALAAVLAGALAPAGQVAGGRPGTRPVTLHDEIAEQPEVAARLLAAESEPIDEIGAWLRERPLRHVVIAARGTSDHAAIYAQYVLGVRNRLSVGLGTRRSCRCTASCRTSADALVIGISQSGASPDIVAVIGAARAQGSPTIAITNEPVFGAGRRGGPDDPARGRPGTGDRRDQDLYRRAAGDRAAVGRAGRRRRGGRAALAACRTRRPRRSRSSPRSSGSRSTR